MRSDTMSLQDFAEVVREDLQMNLSGLYPGVQTEIQQVEKIQGESYLGIRLDRGIGQVSPVINIEHHYHDLNIGKPLNRIINDITETALGVMQNIPDIQTAGLRQYDEMKDKLITQVIPVKGNEDRLANMPHQIMEDMAVVCRAMIGNAPGQGEMSFLVTNPVLQEYGVTKEQLFADAAANMQQQCSIRPLFNVLSEMDPFLADEPVPETDNALFVATNAMRMYGAGVIAIPDFMQNAEETLRGSFFVLPSSLHEVLLLRDDGMTDYRGLEAMVREINATQVAPSDRLTDNVYHYDAVERVFETAKHFAERQIEKDTSRGSVLKDLAEGRQKSQDHQPRARSAPEKGSIAL